MTALSPMFLAVVVSFLLGACVWSTQTTLIKGGNFTIILLNSSSLHHLCEQKTLNKNWLVSFNHIFIPGLINVVFREQLTASY